MPDSPRSTDPELTALADDFDIVGEIAGPSSQFLIATRKAAAGKRRDDSSRVLIEIVRPPEGDESHALDHLASDTKLLSNLRHRRLVSILEGRWLGDDAFAVVREYVDDPSAADLLARGDAFTNTRAAAILREVHGILRWARDQDVVHRRVTANRLFLEPTTDRVRVSFGVGPVQRVRTIDATTEDVVTVVRLAMAMLTGGRRAEAAEERSFAELRPDLPARLHEETARLLAEPATDLDLTLYLALIGMADPVAEGETERDRIRAEVLEEQRVEREKLAKQRAEVAGLDAEERRRLAEEGEELRGAFAQEKATLEREFAAAQRLLAAERAEMQRIIADERAELVAKRNALEREVAVRFAELERTAAADRASLDALRARIQKAGEIELEKKRAAALEDLDDSDFRLDTGRYVTPRFIAPKLTPLPSIAFRRDAHLAKPEPIDAPTVESEPWSVVKVVSKLRAPRRRPIRWRRWAVRGSIAAAILIVAGSVVVIESRSPDFSDTLGASAPAPRTTRASGSPPVAAPVATPSPQVGTPTYTSESGVVATPPVADSVAARARRDSVRRANSARANAGITPSDSTERRPAVAPIVRRPPAARRDEQDLMLLNDSLAASDTASSGGAPAQQEPGGTRPR
jgi:serine/threonine protein kinase